MRLPHVVRSTLGLLAFGGCGTLGPSDRDPDACPQTGEFSNFGCARFAAVLTTRSGAPAADIALSAVLLDSLSMARPNGLNSDRSDAQGRVGLHFTWYAAPPPTSDTVRMRIVALRINELGGPPQRIDSLNVVVFFAPVGQRPPFDTTRWQLRE